MGSSFSFYIACIIAAVVAFVVAKKITSCLLKAIVLLAMLAGLGYLLYLSSQAA